MAEERKTFHESWYRIAGQRICLRPSVVTRRQVYRGSIWYVFQDQFSNQFFRLAPSAYDFVVHLNMNKTVEQVWGQMMARDPDNAPGQEDVIQILAQLYHANLLHYELPADSKNLFERYKKKKQRLLKTTIMNIMFFRIPLIDPDIFLKKTLPLIRWLITPMGALIWLIVLGMGLKVVIDHFSALQIQSQGILASTNLFLLYIGLVVIKTLHEFGHACAVRRFGGEVHTMGVMFLIFNPVPYMDASAAWAFRSKWKRVFVGAAGMIVEVFVAAGAVFVWANTGSGVIHSLAYNMLFIASVSTILFNINPLLRFDGYYILSDLLDIPNLHTHSTQHLTYLIERYAFGSKEATTPVTSKREAAWVTTFGILSGIYRVFVFSMILLFIADRFLLAGIIMAVVCGVMWVVVPVVKLVQYLTSSPRIQRVRFRAISVAGGTLAVVLGFLMFCPFPHNFKSPGIVKADEYMVIVNNVEGYVRKLTVPSGTHVKPGDTLFEMYNEELDIRLKRIQAKLRESQARRQLALDQIQADLKPIDSQIEAIKKEFQTLKQDKQKLSVKTEIEGTWIAPELEDYLDLWLYKGTPVGQIINGDEYYFASVVSQQDTSFLFSNEIKSSHVKLSGQADISIPVHNYTKIPMEHTRLPSVALGWGAGGDIPIDTRDGSGLTTVEPFYEVRASIEKDTDAALYHGQSGRIRFKLAVKPLLRQWWSRLRQLIQKRYQI